MQRLLFSTQVLSALLSCTLCACGDPADAESGDDRGNDNPSADTIVAVERDACEGNAPAPVDSILHASLRSMLEGTCSEGWRYCGFTCSATPCALAAGFPRIDDPTCDIAATAMFSIRLDIDACLLETYSVDAQIHGLPSLRAAVAEACDAGCFPDDAKLCTQSLESIFGITN